MFGFVNVYKNELRLKDYNLFRAYYCGLCKALGKRHNQPVRLGLSYDMTFLAIIADSLNDNEPKKSMDGCIKHIGSHMIIKDNTSIDFAADMSIVLCYYKLCDDIKDDKSIKAFFARMPYVRPFKRVQSNYSELCDKIRLKLSELSVLEKEACPSVDMAADPFASLTSDIFSAVSPKLSKLGYNIGRFIYIADAYKDIEEDKKSGSYNPFLYLDHEYLNSSDFIENAKGSFNMTLNAIASSYRELNIKKNKDILDNIIYYGLRYAYEELFNFGGKDE